MNKKNKKIIAIAAVVLAVVIAAMGLVYHFFGPQTKLDKPVETTVGEVTQTEKQGMALTIEVITADGEKKTHEINTEANNLGDALVENKLVEGTKGEFGLFITAVDGIKADDAKQEWWCITKNGEMLQTGADTTPIADGDKFELTLKVGYDM